MGNKKRKIIAAIGAFLCLVGTTTILFTEKTLGCIFFIAALFIALFAIPKRNGAIEEAVSTTQNRELRRKDKEKKMTVEEAVELSLKQGENLTRDIITNLEELIEHKETTHLRLIMILAFSLKQAIDEMIAFRPEVLPEVSLEEAKLSKLYKALEELEKEESGAMKEYEKKRSRKENH